jgi:hypothetical protein
LEWPHNGAAKGAITPFAGPIDSPLRHSHLLWEEAMRILFALLGAVLFTLSAAATTPQADSATRSVATELHSYVLLDRTGSMGSIWQEALSSVNAYAKGLASSEDGARIDPMITVAMFDHHDGMQFNALRRKVLMPGWSDIDSSEASPRGTTPLFDAIGRIVAMAEGDAPERAVIVIMTDGLENASEEFNQDTARAALDRVRERGWEVVFLGADFASFGDAGAVGMDSSKTMAVSQGRMRGAMESLARKARSYASADAPAPIEFNESDREEAGEDAVKERKGGN